MNLGRGGGRQYDFFLCPFPPAAAEFVFPQEIVPGREGIEHVKEPVGKDWYETGVRRRIRKMNQQQFPAGCFATKNHLNRDMVVPSKK